MDTQPPYVCFRGENKSTWKRKTVDCWFCLKKNSVTQENRCYIPLRSQHKIVDTFDPEKPKDDKFGFFHTWNCALGYCLVHFPNTKHKIQEHATAHGFVGIVGPTLDPRFGQTNFDPMLEKDTDLIPKSKIGKYMRRVPQIEQAYSRLNEKPMVFEEMDSFEEKKQTHFSKEVLESLNLVKADTILNQQTQQPTKPTKISKRKHPPPPPPPPLPSSFKKKRLKQTVSLSHIYVDEELSLDDDDDEDNEETEENKKESTTQTTQNTQNTQNTEEDMISKYFG